MKTGDEFLASLADAARDSGWTLSKQAVTADQVVVAFVRNDSPYGEDSSVHRTRQRIAVVSDVLARRVAEQGFGGTQIEGDKPT